LPSALAVPPALVKWPKYGAFPSANAETQINAAAPTTTTIAPIQVSSRS